MTKEDFIKLYCEKSQITQEELFKSQVVLPCQVYYPADKRNVELKEIKGDKAIIRLKFAGYWHNYDKEVLLSELMPIAEHKHDVDSFNGHCQVCGKYCR